MGTSIGKGDGMKKTEGQHHAAFVWLYETSLHLRKYQVSDSLTNYGLSYGRGKILMPSNMIPMTQSYAESAWW